MKVAWLTLVIAVGACGGGAVDAPGPRREALPIPSATSDPGADASSILPAPSLPASAVAPNGEALLAAVNGEKKCVELARAPATEAVSKLTVTGGTACRPATLLLGLEKNGDAELLRSASLRVAPLRLRNAMGHPTPTTESCTVTETAFHPYASSEACEAARTGAGAPSLGDACAQRLLDRAFTPDPRLARVNDTALVRAMKERGQLFVITGKARQCADWTFEHGSADDFHGNLHRHFTRKQGKEDVSWSRSYFYDPVCKAFGVSGYSVTVTTKTGGNGSASSDSCTVTGALERANADAIDVGDRTLFLTEAACKAAARAPASRPAKGAASPYVADDEGC